MNSVIVALIYLIYLQIPIGYTSLSSGMAFDIRDVVGINTNIMSNNAHFDQMAGVDAERTPERVVHAKGSGAFGYFEVTHDVSKYTFADVFNGIGKRTPIVARFSQSVQNIGGNDLTREMKGLSVKFYSKEGNLDLLGINYPVYFYKDPMDFSMFVHALKRNPRTNLIDNSARIDFITLRPSVLHGLFWMLSDYGIPESYRRMEAFMIHAYLIHNKRGDKYVVRFSFRPELGFANLTTAQAVALGATDPDYLTRDLYNAIEEKNFPAWRLEMDVLKTNNLTALDFDPFEVTELWKNDSYYTVQIGRLVLNKNPENHFEAIEQLAFNPSNLVPGIHGPIDILFDSRKFAYRDTQNYRLGVNHNKIEVNRPKYFKTYIRDGKPPLNDNMRDAPNYYPNSYNGPEPVVDVRRIKKRFVVFQRNVIDLEPTSYFYNHILTDDAQRQRLVDNVVLILRTAYPEQLVKRFIKLMTLIDSDLGKRTEETLMRDRASSMNTQSTKPLPPPSGIEKV